MSDGPVSTPEPERLAGRVTEFVRIGDTVRRPATESSASVQQLLIHLEQAGFDGAPRFLGTEPDGSIVLSWIDGWVPADTECWRLDHKELASVGELLRSYHDCVAEFTPKTGFEEGPQSVGAGQVVCHGDIAPRNTVFSDGRVTAFIDWDGIFVSTPMWDLAHAVWQFAPVCDDADPWLDGWPSSLDRPARIAALVGGCRLAAERADELADMVIEVIAGIRRAVVRKIAAGMPAFVQMEREGILDTLDSQRRAAERLRPLIARAASGTA
ncbi:MAG: phosphotransferase [Acidimicrobiales bacterium]|nr:phosphotransferase [Acidimicrobiales bacterium]MXX44237.1 phosphotransferase [Acidimicrobiales bacterium]MXZ14289.1 phosphotransferase [Acidimicrobiales bacterium]MYB82812.1 phosphotransferase [Acidimicrobiales bacterium]MYD34329.1 phosphotransferase [Acidimicrobiales bacterium]